MISDIIIIVLIILFTVFGAIRGFLKTIFKLAAVALSSFIANQLSAPVGNWVYSAFIRQNVLNNIEQEITKRGFSSAMANSLQSVPDWVRNMLITVFKPWGVSVDDLQKGVLINDSQAQSIAETIEKPLGEIISGVLGIIVSIILFFIIMLIAKLLIRALLNLFQGSGVGCVNRFFGGLFGLAEGFVFVIVAIQVVSAITSIANPAIQDNPTYFGSIFNALCIFRR